MIWSWEKELNIELLTTPPEEPVVVGPGAAVVAGGLGAAVVAGGLGAGGLGGLPLPFCA